MIVLDNFVLLYKDVIVLPLCFIVGLRVRKTYCMYHRSIYFMYLHLVVLYVWAFMIMVRGNSGTTSEKCFCLM